MKLKHHFPAFGEDRHKYIKSLSITAIINKLLTALRYIYYYLTPSSDKSLKAVNTAPKPKIIHGLTKKDLTR
jgi:hypothetical protein